MSPHSPAFFSFPSLGKNGLLPFCLMRIARKGSQFPTVLSGPLSGGVLWEAARQGAAPWSYQLHNKAAIPPQTSSNFYTAKQHQQTCHWEECLLRWHVQLCLSSGVLHHNTVPWLAQRKKSGSSQKAILWQRKSSVIRDMTNFICSALELHIETSLWYMRPTPNFLSFIGPRTAHPCGLPLHNACASPLA